jgi:iron complex outermembrane receptor protein
VASGGYLVAPEIPTDYEVGFHATLLERRLQVNGTLFDETFKNFQATAYDATANATTLVNAGELRSRGAELETLATPTRGLNLSANLTYTDAEFTNFPDAPCYPGQTTAAGSRCHAFGASSVQSLAGEPLNNAPRWSLTLGASYTHALPWHDLTGYADVNYAYRSAVNYSLTEDPNTIQRGYGLASLNTGVQFPARRIRIGLFARNLFDTRFASYIYPSSFQAGNVTTKAGYSQFIPEDAHRVVGVALSGKF